MPLSHDLDRFISAQEPVWSSVIAELTAGKKRSHWMWFVFPQLRGLGTSSMAVKYGISSIEEARSYAAHPVLGKRLNAGCQLLLDLLGHSATAVLGSPDDMKLRSSMTLFAMASENTPHSIYTAVLEKYYAGQMDEKTLALLP